jgi:hypothetical protein
VLQDQENDVSFPIGELVDQLMEMFLHGHRLKCVQIFTAAIFVDGERFCLQPYRRGGLAHEKLSGEVAGDYLPPAPEVALHADHIRDGLDCPREDRRRSSLIRIVL